MEIYILAQEIHHQLCANQNKGNIHVMQVYSLMNNENEMHRFCSSKRTKVLKMS